MFFLWGLFQKLQKLPLVKDRRCKGVSALHFIRKSVPKHSLCLGSNLSIASVPHLWVQCFVVKSRCRISVSGSCSLIYRFPIKFLNLVNSKSTLRTAHQHHISMLWTPRWNPGWLLSILAARWYTFPIFFLSNGTLCCPSISLVTHLTLDALLNNISGIV